MPKDLLKIIALSFFLLANGGRERLIGQFSTGEPKAITKTTNPNYFHNYNLPFFKDLNMQIGFGDYNYDGKIDASILFYYPGTENMILHYFYNKGDGEIEHEVYKP